MTIRKHTAQELATGAVQSWSKGKYRVELRYIPGDPLRGVPHAYTIRLSEGRTSHIETYWTISKAHSMFNRYVKAYIEQAAVETVTNRLLYGQCAAADMQALMGDRKPTHSHRFEFDSMNGETVCVYCGLVIAQASIQRGV